MIKVSVLYPNGDGVTFDMEYYRTKHIPLVLERCAGAVKRGEVERGIGGAVPGAAAPFIAAGHLVFDSVESMQASFGQHVAEFVADIPNFTNAQPTLQIGEVVA